MVELGFGARVFAWATKGCCGGRAWHGRAAEGCPVAFGSTRSSAGHTEAGIVGKIYMDMTITTLLPYLLDN